MTRAAVAAPTTKPVPSEPTAPSGPRIEVWVPDSEGGIDHLAQATGLAASSDDAVRTAYATGERVLGYVQREFGRAGFDGRGAALKLRVHAPDPMTGEQQANNAYWFDDEQRIWLGDGDGRSWAPLGGGADVVAHEFFHGVIDSELALRYVGQEGALHESFADVLASGIDGNWQIGEDVYTPGVAGDALRDLSKLTYTDWRSFPAGEDEVHAMSEIPSHAAYLAAQRIGAHDLRQVWYAAVRRMPDHAGFASARDATIAAARTLYGASSTQAQAVTDAWAAVGITADTPRD